MFQHVGVLRIIANKETTPYLKQHYHYVHVAALTGGLRVSSAVGLGTLDLLPWWAALVSPSPYLRGPTYCGRGAAAAQRT
jgi:hypothetical protein